MSDEEWKMPLLAKVYEAFSAVVDGRVTLFENYAHVTSSDFTKTYHITWEDDVYSSNDNASYWHGAMGYPVIAVLMKQGRLTYDMDTAVLFSKIEWKSIIRSVKNDYTRAAFMVLEQLQASGIDIKNVVHEAEKVYDQIRNLKIKRRRGSVRPPS